MAFLDVLPSTDAKSGVTALVVLQSDHLDGLATLLVAPCRPEDGASGLGRLTPTIEVDGRRLRVFIPEIAAIARSRLSARPIGDAKAWRDDLVGAVDLLVLGF